LIRNEISAILSACAEHGYMGDTLIHEIKWSNNLFSFSFMTCEKSDIFFAIMRKEKRTTGMFHKSVLVKS